MKSEFRKTEDEQLENERIEMALRHFRDSVRAWSDEEFSRPRTIVHSRWDNFWRAAANPAMGWALAGVLMLGGVAVPVSVVHERQAAAEQAKKLAIQQQQERLKEEAARQQADVAMNDDELLSHVDSDIAQSTPDAMQPLASLMNDANGN
jgi:hypothetical protein